MQICLAQEAQFADSCAEGHHAALADWGCAPHYAVVPTPVDCLQASAQGCIIHRTCGSEGCMAPDESTCYWGLSSSTYMDPAWRSARWTFKKRLTCIHMPLNELHLRDLTRFEPYEVASVKCSSADCHTEQQRESQACRLAGRPRK